MWSSIATLFQSHRDCSHCQSNLFHVCVSFIKLFIKIIVFYNNIIFTIVLYVFKGVGMIYRNICVNIIITRAYTSFSIFAWDASKISQVIYFYFMNSLYKYHKMFMSLQGYEENKVKK